MILARALPARIQRPPRTIFGLLVAGLWFTAFDVAIWIQTVARDPYTTDLRAYLAAARIGLERGWPHIYDLGLQWRYLAAVTPSAAVVRNSLPPYASLPVLAFAVVPVAYAPYLWVLAGWLVLSLVGLLAVVWWSAPPAPWLRPTLILLALGWYPVEHDFQIAQVSLLVACSVAAAWWLDARGKWWLAGAFLALVWLKPNCALLVPLAFVAAGRWRTATVFAGVTAVAAAVSLYLVGEAGVRDWIQLSRVNTALPFNRYLTLAGVVDGWPTAILQVLIGGLAVGFSFRAGRLEPGLVILILGGLELTPYLHTQDLSILIVAACLHLRARLGWSWILPLAWSAGEVVWVIGPLALHLAVLAWLARVIYVTRSGTRFQAN